MFVDVRNIKLVLWGFDDTLCIHQAHVTRDENVFNSRIMEYGADAWTMCLINKQLREFMLTCMEKNIKQLLFSCSITSRHAQAKVDWIKNNYGVELEDYCVGRNSNKLPIAKVLASVYGLKESEILVISADKKTLRAFADEGFCVCSPIQLVSKT